MPIEIDQDRLQYFLDIPFVPQGTIFYAPKHWATSLGLEAIENYELPNKQLDRGQVREYCRDPETPVLFGYLCAMAWGGQGMGVTRRHAISAWQHKDRLAKILGELRANPKLARKDAYELFSGENAIPGLGPSYWTKLIYFFSEPNDRYIMDQWTAKSINYLWDSPVVPMAGHMPNNSQCNGEIYETFCSCVDCLAQIATEKSNHGKSWSGDEIEQRLFSVGGRNPGAFRERIRNWQPGGNNKKGRKKLSPSEETEQEEKLWVPGQTLAQATPFYWTLKDDSQHLIIIRNFNDHATGGRTIRKDQFSISELSQLLNKLRTQFPIEGIPLKNSVAEMPAMAATEGLGPAIYHLASTTGNTTKAQAASQLAAILVSIGIAKVVKSRGMRIVIEHELNELALWTKLQAEQDGVEA